MSTIFFESVPGVQVVPIGSAWAGFSPLTFETLILNNESAAILEVLATAPCSLPQLAAELASDCGDAPDTLLPALAAHCQELAEAGFLRSTADHSAP